MKQLYNNYAKIRQIIIHDFVIYFRQSTCVFCSISLKWDLDIGKILVTSSFIKHKQFDFSLLVNGMENIDRKLWPSTRNHFRQFCFQSKPVKEMFYLQFIRFLPYKYVHVDGEVTKCYIRRLCPKVRTLSNIAFWQETLLFMKDRASNLKPFSQNKCGRPLDFISWINNQLGFQIPV